MTTLTIRSHSYVSDTNEEMSAAEALLRVSPSSKQINPSALHCRETTSIGSFALLESLAEQADALRTVRTRPVASSVPKDEEFSSTPISSSRINGGLDALATLAAEARSQTTTAPSDRGLGPHLVASGITAASPSSSSDDDSDSMPPPPPRRRRSASNPEGMEKWDSLSRDRSSRRHFVLPASILEEELAEASAAIQHQKQLQRQRTNCIAEVPEENCRDDDSGDSSASPDSVFQLSSPSIGDTVHEAEQPDDIDEEEVNESDLSPDELLKRARSRLLEDLSEGNMNGEKGVLTLPHSLGKYKEVYNKHGRIGIYTPAERAAIIARFNKKRQRRVWNKKIRYNCRKSLADRRLRVKGRFVKRSEQEQLAKEIQARVEKEVFSDQELKSASTNARRSKDTDMNVINDANGEGSDEDMPDVADPDAGFAPTEDQPYRRLRRHTIT